MALDVDTKKRILNIIDTEVEFTFIKEAPWHTESVAKSLSALIRTTLFPITPTDNTKASEIATAVKNRVDKAGALLTPEEQEFLLQEINIRLVNSVVLPIEAAQKFYEEARTYDLHYSNIRTTLVTFFLTAAVGMLTVVAQDKFPNSAVPLYMGIPLAFALLSFLLGAYFLKLTRCCAVIESHLEKAIQNSAVDNTVVLPREQASFRQQLGNTYGTQHKFLNPFAWDGPQWFLLIIAAGISLFSIQLYNHPETVKHIDDKNKTEVAVRCTSSDNHAENKDPNRGGTTKTVKPSKEGTSNLVPGKESEASKHKLNIHSNDCLER